MEHSNPPLTGAQQEHAAAVWQALHAAIGAAGGWLSFSDYLRLVLYAPGLGYYSAGAAKFGAAGDFVTAPELSPLFGHCVARQCAPLLQALRADAAPGTSVDLFELGAGSGRLAAQVLTRLAMLQALPDRYLILEVSAELRARQQALLAALPSDLRARVQWLDSWPAVPVRAVVLANEVADALPFDCFAVREAGLMARGVGLDHAGGLAWRERPADTPLREEWQRLSADLPAPLPAGYVSEVCPLLDGWIASLLASLEHGTVLLFDYGLGRGEYYHPSRFAGTLRCHYRHLAHDDPFLHPGLQDITAWVDFTRVAEAAHAGGGSVAGYCTQAAFLLGAGLEPELALAADEGERIRWNSQARQLLLPGEMGETFKAMAIAKGIDASLGGFAVQDLRRLL